MILFFSFVSEMDYSMFTALKPKSRQTGDSSDQLLSKHLVSRCGIFCIFHNDEEVRLKSKLLVLQQTRSFFVLAHSEPLPVHAGGDNQAKYSCSITRR